MNDGRTLLALPVDGRPAVRSQPMALARCARWTLRMPEVAALGHFRTPADTAALAEWLLREGESAAGFVLSLDMLVYGGLVPSRFVPESLPVLLQRLAVLDELKKRWPGKPIWAFASTMRISNNDIAEEEKPYWAQHGRDLWAWSFHGDRAEHHPDSGARESSRRLADAAAARVPLAIQHDYRATRARNVAVTHAALERVASGAIERLVLPQDDTAEYGFNIAERRAWQRWTSDHGLASRVPIYAGADEAMHTLVARAVTTLEGRPPLKLALAASDPEHLDDLTALYEDRPLRAALAAQAEAVGAVWVGDDESADAQADVLVALHTQGAAQGDWAMGKPLPQRVPVEAGWFERIGRWQAAGRPVVLVDAAYANGGDPWLLAHPALVPKRLAAYSAWNTASNRLGSAFATAQLAHGAWGSEAAREALALRLLEDGLYQGQLRALLRGTVDAARTDKAELLAMARHLLLPPLNAWSRARGLGFVVDDLDLPWQRSFEIDLHLAPTRP
jgi:hypothetical protein